MTATDKEQMARHADSFIEACSVRVVFRSDSHRAARFNGIIVSQKQLGQAAVQWARQRNMKVGWKGAAKDFADYIIRNAPRQ